MELEMLDGDLVALHEGTPYEVDFPEQASFVYLEGAPRPTFVAGSRDEVMAKVAEAGEKDFVDFDAVSRRGAYLNQDRLAIRKDQITGVREVVLQPVEDRKAQLFDNYKASLNGATL